LASNWEWYNYLYAFGGDVFDEEYNITIDTPEAVASLEWVVDNLLEHNIYPPDIATYDYTEFHTLFYQGRVAMTINWLYMYANAQDPDQLVVVGNVAIGRKPGQVTHGGNIGGWSWNVFKMSRNQDLAVAFAKFMSSPDVTLAFAEYDGFAVPRASAATG
jgi:multiple sugar transport system substrate-binding protein